MPLRLAQLNERFKRSVFFLPLAVLVAAFMLAISESAYQGAHGELTDLVKMSRARIQLLDLVQRVTDAETSQRGYIVTGRTEYIEPYRFAASEARTVLENLREAYAELSMPDAEALRGILAADVNEKLDELASVLVLVDNGNLVEARKTILAGLQKSQMERIRRGAQALLAQQNALIDAHLHRIFDVLFLNRMGVGALTAISLLMLVKFLRQSRQLDLQRGEKELAVKAERDQLEVEVERRTAELTQLAQYLQSAREDERARLARDLHDELGALLTAAKLDVARIRPKLARDAPELMERLTHLTETLNAGIALKRNIIEDLRPSTLENLGLGPALEILCREFSGRSDINITAKLRPVRLSPDSQLSVFRIVQETLTNIAKHARATEVEVSLCEDEDVARIRVRDNGVGFDPAKSRRNSHGLAGMRFRVEAERGSLNIVSAPNAGTLIEASLPLAATDEVELNPAA